MGAILTQFYILSKILIELCNFSQLEFFEEEQIPTDLEGHCLLEHRSCPSSGATDVGGPRV